MSARQDGIDVHVDRVVEDQVFGEAGIAGICPNYRLAIVAPTT